MDGISIWQLIIIALLIGAIYAIYRLVTSTPKDAKYKDTIKVSKWTVWLLYAQVVISVVAIISGMLEYQLLSDFNKGVYSSQELAVQAGETNDARQAVLGIVQITIFIVSGILILRWIYLSSNNAYQFSDSKMRFTPGWSVGWYFIPIAQLWKPYQAMKEIWNVSSSPKGLSIDAAPAILRWWWFFWIVSNFFANASYRLAMGAEEINEFIAANIVTQLSDAIAIPLSLIVVTMVKRLTEVQTARIKEIGGAKPAVYPTHKS